MRTLEVTQTRGAFDNFGEKFRVEVPDGAKVTYAGLNPQQPHAGCALRIYRTSGDQLACFTGVTGFRDVSLRIQRAQVVEDTESNEIRSRGPKGAAHVKVAETVTQTEWVDV